MKKTIFLLLLFLLLGGMSYYFLSTDKDQKKTTIDVSDRRFAVKNIEEVHKIFLANRSQQSATLTRNGDHWLYDGKYRARQTAVNNLLKALQKIDIKHLPAKAALPGIIEGLASHGIKVEIYDKNNNKLKAYYVGGVTNDERGTYMIMEGKDNPYVMHVPSSLKNLRSTYWMPPFEWRDRGFFREDPEKIKSVSIEYPLQQSKSFKLENTGEQFIISPFHDFTPQNPGAAQSGKIEGFLTGFESVIAENFMNTYSRKDSILSTKPFSIIQVKDINDVEKEFRLYPIYLDDGRVERYYGFMKTPDTEDFYMTQHRVLKKILWSYESFF